MGEMRTRWQRRDDESWKIGMPRLTRRERRDTRNIIEAQPPAVAAVAFDVMRSRCEAFEKLANMYHEGWEIEHVRRVRAEALAGGLANDKAELTEQLVHRDNAVDYWTKEAARRSDSRLEISGQLTRLLLAIADHQKARLKRRHGVRQDDATLYIAAGLDDS